MKVVFWATLCVAAALVGCDKPVNEAATTNTTPEKRLIFDPTWEKLPPHFEEALKPRTVGDQVFGLVYESGNIPFANSGSLLASISLVGPTGDQSPTLHFGRGSYSGGAWVGQNAFGAKRTVVEEIEQRDFLYLENFKEFQCLEIERNSFTADSLVLRALIKVPQSSAKVKCLVLGTLRKPVSTGAPFRTGDPTFQNPVESKLEVTSVHGDVTALWFFDESTLTVYSKIDVRHPTNWREEVARIAENGDGDAAEFLAQDARRSNDETQELRWRRIAARAGKQESQRELTNGWSSISRRDVAERLEAGDIEAALKLLAAASYLSTNQQQSIAHILFRAQTDPRVQQALEAMRKDWSASDGTPESPREPIFDSTGRKRVFITLSKLQKQELDEKRAAQVAEATAQAQAAAERGRVEMAERVLKHHQELAAKGDRYGQFSMGMRYLKGDGVERDELRAREYFQKAAAQGYAEARKELERLGK